MSKRPASPSLIPNPFIKKQNLNWTIESPPPTSSGLPADVPTDEDAPINPDGGNHSGNGPSPEPRPTTTAAIESGAVQIDDHLARFSDTLSKHILSNRSPRLSIPSYASLYETHANNPEGCHFVIHQHDHPIAGTHYDLRLQINETSSVSWAIMYGLPGNPNSVRLNRNATETRIHSLWNHLIETASSHTGSLLIWDTGTYSILPKRSKYAPAVDPSSQHSSEDEEPPPTQQRLLHDAFQTRKIRIRLHGSKLPDPYVIYIRLTKSEDAAGRAKSSKSLTSKRTRRRRKFQMTQTAQTPSPSSSSGYSSESEPDDEVENKEHEPDNQDIPETRESGQVSPEEAELRELEDEHVRKTNAYTGATNSIGSIHQRKWFLSLDRTASGLVETRKQGTRPSWALPSTSQDAQQPASTPARLTYPFYVRGRDYEESVVTGRRGVDILKDEQVTNFVPRQGWAPVLN